MRQCRCTRFSIFAAMSAVLMRSSGYVFVIQICIMGKGVISGCKWGGLGPIGIMIREFWLHEVRILVSHLGLLFVDLGKS